MLVLIKNEVNKMLYRRKMLLITAIMLILVSLFSYGQNYQYKNTIDKYMKTTNQTENIDWQSLQKQQIQDLKNRLNRPDTPEASKASINIKIQQNQYYLDNNINPITPSAAKFTVKLMEQSIFVLLPLLIIILAGDSVCGEFSAKTIKVLLTRATPRWKILLSKYIALVILFSLVILEMGVLSLLISGFLFNNWGLYEPIATGFNSSSGILDTSNVIKVTQLQYVILVYSLGWFVSIIVGTVSFMVSVLVRNTATSIGIMMATLIGGGFLQLFLADWPIVKYFFVINLNLPQYLTGSYTPIPGMSLLFSTLVLLTWGICAFIISFAVFTKQDVLV
ncbi:ABC-2 type transport system permease protein [Clostridium saccharoperbutylacetonicum]|uniref:ABC-2 family transporter protein n=1 Tax=Clostridium saccharoperbutylacetonicum N1-4(HMT) TaxID=931276 RepID=M1MRS6_9CLOT|nr:MULTISPECIES: ABC transporter permease [Clostridium]AGF54267.1 ABC-2 family transporter protein [Clostridium saccharoperbutylacetonicum N1-4(HMT)]NRT59217.1 ABC-2 type transport system permease protein [Clostridium saccharoperbutylacetonicum]NSB28406.1 ABC-2 type transport system permease protein [Clostridium saccharoperbutylacetonicum]NSB41895.1 ABC-2 type transport system permease protein [Clostridium saccharoperbutylacetonicum]